jgi:type I restriction enzyme S subunit
MTVLRVPSAREKLIDSSTQTTNIANISLGRLRPFVLNLPSFAEQQDIVTKVDKLMALCDQLEQQQKHRDNLRIATRKSTIDAISTATTPEELETAWKRINNNWDVIADTPESVGSLRELVLRLGTRIGFGVDLQKSPKQKLNEVSHVSWGNLSLTKTSYVEDGQFLAVSAAGPDGRIGHAEHDKLTPVISAIGARCGTMFMPGENFTAIKNTMTVTPNLKKINNWYLFYALKGSQLPRRGTAQPFLSKTDIENFEVTVPSSLEDQRVIVGKVDELMALCDQLESELKSRTEVAEKFARSVVSAA